MSLNITFWGGVGSVTGANFLLEDGKTRILVDCGLLQDDPNANLKNSENFPYDPKTIDFLFITHAHMDHIGRVPKLVRDGFRGAIFSTPETRELAEVMLDDALKIMSDNTQSAPNMPSPALGMIGARQLYEKTDLEKTFSLWKHIPYHFHEKIADDISVEALDAGHILGSTMYKFNWNGKNVVFTGDSGNSPSPLLRDTDKLIDVDYLVMDSVYGNKNHESKEKRDDKFRQIVSDSIKKKGTLIIPAFSMERTQVILYELNNLVEKGKIKSVPVYLDSPLAERVTKIYRKYPSDFNGKIQKQIRGDDDIFRFPKLEIVHGMKESQSIDGIPGPKIIIAGSGMSTGGRIVGHEVTYLPDPKATILLAGYQAVGTLGRKIQEVPLFVEIYGNKIPIKAKVEMIAGYSSHKDSDHLLDMVSDTARTLKKVFVTMGEPASSLYLVQHLRDQLGIDALYPERGRSYELK